MAFLRAFPSEASQQVTIAPPWWNSIFFHLRGPLIGPRKNSSPASAGLGELYSGTMNGELLSLAAL